MILYSLCFHQQLSMISFQYTGATIYTPIGYISVTMILYNNDDEKIFHVLVENVGHTRAMPRLFSEQISELNLILCVRCLI